MPAHSKKSLYFNQMLQEIHEGKSLAAIIEKYPVHYNSALEWFKEEKVSLPKVGIKHTGRKSTVYEFNCDFCGKNTTSQRSQARFCSRNCASQWKSQKSQQEATPVKCPCGKEFLNRTNRTKKFCSKECQFEYQDHRKSDPLLYITFDCEYCKKEVTRRKSYGTNPRFCSNACAARSNHKMRHIVDLEDSVVLDSGWEALFYGLCRFRKLPIKRVDRSEAITFIGSDGNEHHYAPDFKVRDLYVEIKGLEDDDDRERYEAWPNLVVIDKNKMEFLLSNSENIEEFLYKWSSVPYEK